MNEPRLVADPWLSGLLGKAAFHLQGPAERIAACRATLAAQLGKGVAFADAKTAVEDVAAAAALQSLRFGLIDTNLRFEAPRSKIADDARPGIKFASAGDADAVASIAGRSFVSDRFHRDPAISTTAANAIKSAWAHNFFSGRRGDYMVTARRDGAVAGFLQLLKGSDGSLVIDLVAVGSKHRGTGLARAMIGFAARACDGEGVMAVGTQVGNIPSIRLYESLGFRMTSAQYVFHRHGVGS